MTKRSDTFDGSWTGAREFTIDCGNVPQIAASSTKADMYCSSVIPYKGQYIGLPTMYYHPTTQADGPVYPTFMYSRDSSTWSFEDPYKPIIDLSAHGQFRSDSLDFGQAYMMTTMPEKDGWLYMYYGWYPEQHNTFPQSSSITYLAKLPEDRFVGIQATGSGGVWTTSAITLSSDPGQLLVNAVVGGDLRVEILDASTMDCRSAPATPSMRPRAGAARKRSTPWRAGPLCFGFSWTMPRSIATDSKPCPSLPQLRCSSAAERA
jgi:hypothetical protein